MDSPAVKELQESELQKAKEQLEIQQNIHLYLVKKVADMEQELESKKQELAKTSEELLNEIKVSSQLRDSVIVMNEQCTNFFTSYQEKLESFDNLNLSWLYLGYDENECKSQPQSKSFVATRPAARRAGVFSPIEEELESISSENVNKN